MMWATCAEKSKKMGVTIEMNAEVIGIEKEGVHWSVNLQNGRKFTGFDFIISSAPIREFIPSVFPKFPSNVIASALKLSYRDFITVVLICKETHAFADNWIYIHEPSVKVGRIQNYKSWSPDMVPDQEMVCYGLEYFCFEGDGLWKKSDSDLINLGKTEICQIGLISSEAIIEGYVVRQTKAYPVYDHDYKFHLQVIRDALKSCHGLYLIGRNGMHKYNNQDHSMMTAMLASKNIIAGKEIYDIWDVNEDAEYNENSISVGANTISNRMVPQQNS